jgi:uncharacterized SAM-binding protein YcdF (DUF218 family)
MNPVVSAVAKSLLLPPGIIIALFVVALLLMVWRRRLAVLVAALSLSLLLLCSLPVVARRLAGQVEPAHALTASELKTSGAGAIVVLGCGRNAAAPEYGGDVPAACALVRLRYGARLHADTGLPILVSAGRVWDEPRSEAALMAETLRRRFGVNPRWVEGRSRNTWENALYSTGMLKEAGVDSILLVTYALHMKRAAWAFRQMGITVTPAPTYFQSRSDRRPAWLNWLPSAHAMLLSSDSLREMIGMEWYRWKEGS